jgi:hypothetical protein
MSLSRLLVDNLVGDALTFPVAVAMDIAKTMADQVGFARHAKHLGLE